MRISARELVDWLAFERVFGPITLQERIDAAGAIAGWGAVAAQGNRVPVKDFLPNWEGQQEQSTEDMIAFMRAFQKKPRGEQ